MGLGHPPCRKNILYDSIFLFLSCAIHALPDMDQCPRSRRVAANVPKRWGDASGNIVFDPPRGFHVFPVFNGCAI
jgi:hypothetical protein